MRIILVGASGTIGKAIDAELCARHEIVRVNRNSGDYQVDIANLQYAGGSHAGRASRGSLGPPGRLDGSHTP